MVTSKSAKNPSAHHVYTDRFRTISSSSLILSLSLIPPTETKKKRGGQKAFFPPVWLHFVFFRIAVVDGVEHPPPPYCSNSTTVRPRDSEESANELSLNVERLKM